MSGRDSGGDIYDMAAKGTTVPEDAAVPRHIKSVPAPDQEQRSDDLGATNLADAATNATDIPRVCSSIILAIPLLIEPDYCRYCRTGNRVRNRRFSAFSSRFQETARCPRRCNPRPKRQRKHKIYKSHCPAEPSRDGSE